MFSSSYIGSKESTLKRFLANFEQYCFLLVCYSQNQNEPNLVDNKVNLTKLFKSQFK